MVPADTDFSMNFPVLTGPFDGAGLTVTSDPSQEYGPSDLELEVKEYPPLNISFPSLETAYKVLLSGNISRSVQHVRGFNGASLT